MKLIARIAAIVLAVCAAGSVLRAQDQVEHKAALTLALVKQIAAAAEQQGCKVKCGGVIAILDDSGELMYLQRVEGNQIGGSKLAIAKARTAFLYRRSTKSFQDRIAKGDSFLLGFPEMLPAAGGIPLIINGQLVGAIGVSGGPGGDEVVAQAGVDALAKIAAP